MVKIAHQTSKYARLNTVVTDRTQRRNGYAGMLVGELCKELLKERVTPMLYADQRNPASNGAYQKIGFEKQGELIEYAVL